ncbi:hypothetical protein Dthio_PD2131 [Desulfonatronospira thiodismutans ASO3-1]|uniref:CRISPR-associated protein Cas6 C-terminal domain-containing protein n=1 Tax=Desulfonatronospira thiodismutans ASO3-1 TaxID=555779 RepID=D6SPS9_9BACT|nr:CRISPR system precrRNA processing endoribonuclease RAMP protein Cas6 [Desulfonatronospira thiodismutans]EFI34755.1 hypothetical protein Dthio_PD2131 [Desulfonatronospira thiodismutans ASO3-1]
MLENNHLEQLRIMTSGLHVLELEFTAVFRISGNLGDKKGEKVYLPQVLRGGWGHKFKEVCCDQEQWREVHSCPDECQCAYGTIFCSRPGNLLSSLGSGQQIPRAYRVSAPFISNRVDAGQVFRFHFNLYGKAIQAWEPCAAAWMQLSESGIGVNNRIPFQITSIVNKSDSNRLIWTMDQPDRIYPPESAVIETGAGRRAEMVHINFTSPSLFAVQNLGKKLPPWKLNPAQLAQTAINRIARLAEIWGENRVEPIRLDYNSDKQPRLMRYRQTGKMTDQRSSQQEKNRQQISGWTGNLLFRGDAGMFAEVMELAAPLGIGQNTTAGFGSYQVYPV